MYIYNHFYVTNQNWTGRT